MHHLTHGVMFAKHYGDHSEEKRLLKEFVDESEEKEELIEGKCIVSTTLKSLITEKVHDLLISLNIPLNSYNNVLSDFDDTCSYLNDMLIAFYVL